MQAMRSVSNYSAWRIAGTAKSIMAAQVNLADVEEATRQRQRRQQQRQQWYCDPLAAAEIRQHCENRDTGYPKRRIHVVGIVDKKFPSYQRQRQQQQQTSHRAWIPPSYVAVVDTAAAIVVAVSVVVDGQNRHNTSAVQHHADPNKNATSLTCCFHF